MQGIKDASLRISFPNETFKNFLFRYFELILRNIFNYVSLPDPSTFPLKMNESTLNKVLIRSQKVSMFAVSCLKKWLRNGESRKSLATDANFSILNLSEVF